MRALAIVVFALQAVSTALGGVETWTVDDATTALLVSDRRAPVVVLDVEFPVGTWSRWGQGADLETAMRIALYDPAGELRQRADRLAISISPWVGSRASGIRVTCLTDDLDHAVVLLRDVLANEELDRSELKRWKREAAIGWRSSLKNVGFRARQAAARMLFERGDPRRERYERAARVETKAATLRDIRNRMIRLPGRTVGFAGDIDRARADAIARDLLLSAIDSSDLDLTLALHPVRAAAEREAVTERVARLTQVYFGFGRESLSMDDPRYPAFVLANHVLGGHFYSRLYVALRHESGETYGAFARSEGDTIPGPFAAASFTRVDNAAHAEATLREVIGRFHEDGMTDSERADALAYFEGRAPFDRRTPMQLLGRRMSERRLGLPFGFFDDVTRRAAAMSLDEINTFIAEYYDPRLFRMARVAPK